MISLRVIPLAIGCAVVLAGCGDLFANVGDGPPEAQCAKYADEARPEWCPGGMVHLQINGPHRDYGFWLESISPTRYVHGGELVAQDITDAPAGSYRAFVPAQPCTVCDTDAILAGPTRCETAVELPAFGEAATIRVSFDAAYNCRITAGT